MSDPLRQQGAVADEFALLVDAVQDYAIFLLSPTGEIRSWNSGAARIFGYRAAEIVGRSFSTFYSQADLDAEKPRLELATAAAEGRVEDEGWRIRGDGQRFWADTVITTLRDPDGALLGFAKVTRDLTERRAAEEQLRQSEEMLRLLVESVKEYAIFMLDPQGNVASWNAGAQRIKGYEADEVIGRHFSRFYTEEDVRDERPAHNLKLAEERGSIEDDGWRLRKDGTRFWANVLITAVRDAAGTLRGFAKVTRDMSEWKQAEETRQALFEQREARLHAEEERRRAEASFLAAQEAIRAKDEFLMTLSHELRTPMTAIVGWARLMPTLPPGDPILREAIASIARSADHQAQLIDDVLDVSRILSGKLRLAPERVDVERVVRASLDAVRLMAEARSVKLELSVAPDLGFIVADATRLQQIIWNLVTNAVKFTPKGGRVEVSANRQSSRLQITVTDEGEGIDPSFLPHIFEPFRQAESPRTRVHGGLGLGLSIVRYLVEAHGGTISAESAGKGEGATFTVTLPVAAVSPPAGPGEGPSVHEETRPIDRDRLRGVRILLVDDDADARVLMRTVLAQAGAEVTVVDSAQAALESLSTLRPDVLLTDIAMPESDGYELARAVRATEQGTTLKIVALSAFPAGVGAGEQSPFDERLRKPIDPVDLVEALSRMVGR